MLYVYNMTICLLADPFCGFLLSSKMESDFESSPKVFLPLGESGFKSISSTRMRTGSDDEAVWPLVLVDTNSQRLVKPKAQEGGVWVWASLKPAVLRVGIELSSEFAGTLPTGSVVSVHEFVRLPDGVCRARTGLGWFTSSKDSKDFLTPMESSNSSPSARSPAQPRSPAVSGRSSAPSVRSTAPSGRSSAGSRSRSPAPTGRSASSTDRASRESGGERASPESTVAAILSSRDYYSVLGMQMKRSKKLPASDFAAAYKRLLLLVHPDKCSVEGAEEAFQKLREAYCVLTDPALRVEYNQEIAGGVPEGHLKNVQAERERAEQRARLFKEKVDAMMASQSRERPEATGKRKEEMEARARRDAAVRARLEAEEQAREMAAEERRQRGEEERLKRATEEAVRQAEQKRPTDPASRKERRAAAMAFLDASWTAPTSARGVKPRQTGATAGSPRVGARVLAASPHVRSCARGASPRPYGAVN